MPRIPYQPEDLAEPADVVSAVRERRGGGLLNLDRMLLHSPAFADGWNHLLGTVRGGLALPGRWRELAICVVAVINRADYEFIHHVPELKKAGGSDAQIKALGRPEAAAADAALFDARERAVIRLALEMTRDVAVSDATFEAAVAALDSHRQVVELVGTIAAYNMVSRFLVALDVQPER